MLKQFYSFIIWICITLITLIYSTLIILASVTLRIVDPRRTIAHKLANAWGSTIFWVNPAWKLKIEGRGFIKRNQAYVLVANHASMSDIICLFCIGRQFKWVAKDSLFRVPFFGWAMSALGYVSLARGSHGSIRETFKQCIKWLDQNISVLIFPEGTRSKTGELGNFKNGAFKLAIETRTPIIPIVLIGTHEVIQKGKSTVSGRIKCKVKILKPIDTSRYEANQFAELKDRIHSQMASILQKVRS